MKEFLLMLGRDSVRHGNKVLEAGCRCRVGCKREHHIFVASASPHLHLSGAVDTKGSSDSVPKDVT